MKAPGDGASVVLLSRKTAGGSQWWMKRRRPLPSAKLGEALTRFTMAICLTHPRPAWAGAPCITAADCRQR
ncbi:hypothetical protein NXC14_PA00483 (plasmid) [Rhizobium sp. NXC14]|nr:hypothetical protein NXC14_PA00483 [Rhizobium sp. NXC14]